jgi:hypothetical protein
VQELLVIFGIVRPVAGEANLQQSIFTAYALAGIKLLQLYNTAQYMQISNVRAWLFATVKLSRLCKLAIRHGRCIMITSYNSDASSRSSSQCAASAYNRRVALHLQKSISQIIVFAATI